jgi:hypothetical protein
MGAEPRVSLCCVSTGATPSNTKSNPTNVIAAAPTSRLPNNTHSSIIIAQLVQTLDASVHTRNDTDTQSPTHDAPCESTGTVQ